MRVSQMTDYRLNALALVFGAPVNITEGQQMAEELMRLRELGDELVREYEQRRDGLLPDEEFRPRKLLRRFAEEWGAARGI